MPLRILGSLAIVFALAPAIVSATDWTVFLRRAGPIHVGMTLGQVRSTLGDPKAVLQGNEPQAANDACAYLKSSKLPEHLGVMFERGRVVRIDVSARGIQTASGIGVGATEEQVKKTYGARIQVQPHKYDPDGHYLRFVAMDDADRHLGLIFETDGRQVTSFRTGTVAAISLVEGCA